MGLQSALRRPCVADGPVRACVYSRGHHHHGIGQRASGGRGRPVGRLDQRVAVYRGRARPVPVRGCGPPAPRAGRTAARGLHVPERCRTETPNVRAAPARVTPAHRRTPPGGGGHSRHKPLAASHIYLYRFYQLQAVQKFDKIYVGVLLSAARMRRGPPDLRRPPCACPQYMATAALLLASKVLEDARGIDWVLTYASRLMPTAKARPPRSWVRAHALK
jgi:hypothetical protein